jgi:arylsulfatase A-like enzyme
MSLRLFFLLGLLCWSASHLGGATPPSSSARPNILIAIADDWSFPHASIYGTSWVRTPHFDRVAREGVLFRNAYTPVAKCAASRTSVLLGRHPWLSAAGFDHWNFFPPEYRTYPEALAAAGYFTGFTGKGWSPGIARDVAGKTRDLLGRAFQARKQPPPTTGIAAVDYAANFADFLAASPAGAPWCFWYGGNEPHRDYEFRSGVTKGGKSLADVDRVPGFWPDHEDVRHDLLDYAMEIEHFDTHLGRMLAELERRGELENTLIIVTADNGMPFPRVKGQSYELASHLPLAVRWPAGIPQAGRVLTDFVTFPDLAPTLLDVAGVAPEASGMAAFSGRSLRPLLASTANGRVDPTRDHTLVGRERHDPGRPHNAGYPIRGIVTDTFLYLHNFAPDRWPSGNPETGYLDTDDGPTRDVLLATRRTAGVTNPLWELNFGLRPAEELYALRDDPDNIRNLAGRPEFAAHQSALRERLFSALRTQGDPRLNGAPDNFFDKFPFANPTFNDLYERWETGKLKLPHWADPETKPITDASLTPARPGVTHINDLSVHDPAILADPATQTYYIYANYSPKRAWDLALLRSPHDRAGVKAWKSKDLVHWEGPELVFEVPEDFWADKFDAPWAPEVHAWQGKYYLFVTFNDWATTLEIKPGRPPITKRASQILVADTPLGPFKPFRNAPHTPPGEMTLDGTFYVDEKGDPWLVYCHEWVQITDGAFKAIRLTPDLSATIGEPILLFHASAGSWTKREINYRNAGNVPGIVTDGPWVHRTKDGTLQLLWASWSKDRDYATAVATSESGTLAGPWRQTPEPLLQDDRGHGALFRDFADKLHLVVHRYFRQPATRVQIYSLDETDSGFSIRARELGAP